MAASLDIDTLFEMNVISNLDYHFSSNLISIGRDEPPLIGFSLAILSRSASLGHICLDIEALGGAADRVCRPGIPGRFFLPRHITMA